MLTLPIKKKWFDMILSGEKTEEYREIKPYYMTRFKNVFEMLPHSSTPLGLDTQNICFKNGYSNASPMFVARCSLDIKKGREEWGAEKNKEYYVLKIHEIISIQNVEKRNTPILDVCCGSKMFYFDKNNPKVTFMDCRELDDVLCDGRRLEIKPDIIGDFRNIPFNNNSFSMVVFDPPHLNRIGENSWMAKKYGKLSDTWKEDISKGFSECMRVLKPSGTLIFKWNEEQIKLSEILPLFSKKPILGNRRAKTHWLVFMKER